MCFRKPKGLKEIAPVQNKQMNYEKAFRHRRKKFEVRYAIRPYDKLFAEYARSRKDSAFYIADPNTMFKTSFRATLLNIADGKDYSYSILDSLELRKEYNADWGAVTTVDAGKEFGMGYKYCTMLYLFRKNTGECYYFFLADDAGLLNKLSQSVSHTLTFKK
jgi:hypothetical protein